MSKIDPSKVHDGETLVRRITRHWLDEGRVTSMAFRHRPQPEDVSVDRLGHRQPQDVLDLAHRNYPDGPRFGAATLQAAEVRRVGADVVPAASIDNMWHANIVPKLTKGMMRALARACRVAVPPPD